MPTVNVWAHSWLVLMELTLVLMVTPPAAIGSNTWSRAGTSRASRFSTNRRGDRRDSAGAGRCALGVRRLQLMMANTVSPRTGTNDASQGRIGRRGPDARWIPRAPGRRSAGATGLSIALRPAGGKRLGRR